LIALIAAHIEGVSMDFDPRDSDSRDEDRFALTRDRNDNGPTLGRGGGNSRESLDDDGGRENGRAPERYRDERARDNDSRDAFTRQLNLPRGADRELVRDRDREYTLRGSESRTLATVGAFRVVSSRDLRDRDNRPADPRSGDLRHLREQGLIETVRVPGYREPAVALTKEGRTLLERHRGDKDGSQTFYNDVKRERELEHDLQVYRAYERQAERLEARGARVDRVVLDYELKRDYQRWLHERDRERSDYDGHPDRTPEEIRDWALEHDLPYFDGEVHFPDLRIEYREADGRVDHDDIDVVTEHYRGAHAASVARSGFISFAGSSARAGGVPFDPERRRR
jgi:DNA-binding PadR family transcriptional regulator